MKFLLALTIVAFLLTNCKKDKFTTEPQVTVKSINPKTVNNGDILTLEAKFTDDQGDIDSVLVVYKWYDGDTPTLLDTIRYGYDELGVPSKTREADLEVTFEYNVDNRPDIITLSGVSMYDTTATFGLILKDKAAHVSNYSESDKIRLKKP